MISVNSFAKINFGLQVLNKRADNFHNINTIFARVSLKDIMYVEESTQSEVVFTNDISIPLEDNLIYKAIIGFKKKFKISDNFKVIVNKKIPMGGGLGGGSSNAAAILDTLSKMYKVEKDYKSLSIIAQTIGSDVPFFLRSGFAVGQSRGELLKYFRAIFPYKILIVNPRINVSTPMAYNSLNRSSELGKVLDLQTLFYRGLENPVIWREFVFNDFEKPIFKQFPEIGEIKNNLYDNGALFALMSGSGSTLFGVFENQEKAEKAEKNFNNYFTSICDLV
jgi:4-diphosphocytidyl-2-C-methyl-D-erythritol kinase